MRSSAMIMILLAFSLSSCTGQDERPRIAQDYMSAQLSEQSLNRLELVSFEKTDGYDKSESIYVMDFTLVFRSTETVRKSGCDKWTSRWCWDNLEVIDISQRSSNLLFEPSDRIELVGKLTMRKTENGWKVSSYKINQGQMLHP